MNEVEIIKKYLFPISNNFKEALRLQDDAAILKNFKNEKFVVSVDNFIQGIHCPKNLSSELIAIRSILCATSDLAAMGASPYCLFLSLTIPKIDRIKIMKDISRGIRKAIKLSKIKLAGGDLTSYNGPIIINVTVVGRRNNANKLLLRKGAKLGEFIGVTGYIGEANIGLNILKKKISISNKKKSKKALNAFLYPPQLHNLSKDLSKIATSCIDISDGLIEDIGKLGQLANCKTVLISKDIPLSENAKLLIETKKFSLEDFLVAGDDYQLGFTFKKENIHKLNKLRKKFNINISVIGRLSLGNGVYLDNKKISGGYSHF